MGFKSLRKQSFLESFTICSVELLFLSFIGVFINSCVSVPGSKNKAFLLTSASEENKMGAAAFQEILKKERISRHPQWTRVIQRVGKRIAHQAPVKVQWDFRLINSKERNAFALPGGKVAFYTGIMPVLKNEAAVAAVMGHEVAHVVARHAGQRMSRAQITGMGLALASTAFGDSKNKNLYMGLLGAGAQVGAILPFSRGHETEADELGLRYAAAAGYDPRQAAQFWTRMNAGKSAQGPSWLSTHPLSNDRVKKLHALARKLMPVYYKSARHGLGEQW